jgi:hypothetical protein
MTYQLLDVSKCLWRLHVDYGLDLLRVTFDSSLRDEVAQKLACRYSEGAFFRVELDDVSIKISEVSRRSSSKLSAFADLTTISST